MFVGSSKLLFFGSSGLGSVGWLMVDFFRLGQAGDRRGKISERSNTTVMFKTWLAQAWTKWLTLWLVCRSALALVGWFIAQDREDSDAARCHKNSKCLRLLGLASTKKQWFYVIVHTTVAPHHIKFREISAPTKWLIVAIFVGRSGWGSVGWLIGRDREDSDAARYHSAVVFMTSSPSFDQKRWF